MFHEIFYCFLGNRMINAGGVTGMTAGLSSIRGMLGSTGTAGSMGGLGMFGAGGLGMRGNINLKQFFSFMHVLMAIAVFSSLLQTIYKDCRRNYHMKFLSKQFIA